MAEKTADEVAAIFSAAGDSVTVINGSKAEGETDAEWKDKLQRNVDHLEIIKAYKKEDGKELTRSFNRNVYQPGVLDASDNLVDTNISGLDADVQAICNAAWTTQVKADYKAFLIANKSSNP